MANFAPTFTAVQSAKGDKIVFTDTSPWGSASTENYNKADFDRVFTIKDAYGATVDTIVLTSIQLTGEITVTKNLWLETTFDVTGVQDYSVLQKQLFDRFTAIAYRDAINEGKCCGSANSLSNVTMANIFLQGVDFAVPIGNGVDVQKFEDAAYKYLTA